MIRFGYGDEVKDVITGYTGFITGYADYYGRRENAYLVENNDSTNRIVQEWIEENRLEKVER